MIAARLLQLRTLVGGHFVRATALRIVPLAALEVAMLLVLRELLLWLLALSGSAPHPAIGAHPGIAATHGAGGAVAMVTGGAGSGTWEAGLRGWLALHPLLALSLAVGVIALRLIGGAWITRGIFQRVLAEQGRMASALFSTYLGQPWRDSVAGDRSAQRQMVFTASDSLVHHLLMPATVLAVDGLVVGALLLVLLAIHPLATLAMMAWMVLMFLMLVRVTRQAARHAGQVRWQAFQQMRRVVDGALGDPRAVKLSGTEPVLTALFSRFASAHAGAVADEYLLGQQPAHLREVVLVTAVAVLAGALMVEGHRGAELASGLAVFAAASIRMFPTLQRAVGLTQRMDTKGPDLTRMGEDLALPVERLAPVPAVPGPLMADSLALERVTLHHPGMDRPVLDAVELTVARGDRLVLSGPSGAGKSSLLLVLCGLLPPTSGRVLIDGEAVPVLDRMRQARVAMVPQDPFFFIGTLAENLAFPRPADTLDRERARRVLDALGLAFALDDRSPETVMRMSGGERQRLAIARAICSGPDLLILDEATSQLDPVSERLACACIVRECAEATMLIIAHRPLPDMVRARQVRLERGRLREATA